MVTKYPPDHPWTNFNSTQIEIRKLQTDRRYRDARGAFFIEGCRNFVQASDQDFGIIAIVYSEKLLTNPLVRKLVRRFRRGSIPSIGVSPERFRQFSQTRRASGISAIVKQRWLRLDSTNLDVGLCWVVLGFVHSPGNLGTLMRTSEAVGGTGFILLDKSVDPYSPNTVRASMGALFRQRLVRTNYPALRRWQQKNRGHVIGASPDGARNYYNFTFPGRTILCLGEERQGLTPKQRSICEDIVRIPMVGEADSLNLGVAGSLLLYEIFRNR